MPDLAEQDRPAAPPERRRRRATTIQVALIVANVLFWGGIFAWTLSVDEDDVDAPDHLDDPAFPLAAEPVCAAALADLEARDLLHVEAVSPEGRADTVDAANGILRAMVVELRSIERPGGEEGEWVASWLDDWDRHIDDRQDWADGLRRGEDQPFSESDRGGEQLSRVIDHFAEVNEMPSCTTTHDV